MASSSAELSHRVSKGGVRRDVEDRVCVFAIEHAAFGQDHRYEMYTGGREQGYGGGIGEELWKVDCQVSSISVCGSVDS